MMKAGVLLLLAILSVLLISSRGLAGCDGTSCDVDWVGADCGGDDCDGGLWKLAKNVTYRSTIHLTGYMDEMSVYQTEKGMAGSKIAYGVQGSGTASRTMTVEADEGGMCDGEMSGSGIYFSVQAEYDYHPYTPITSSGEEDSYLKSALRAKNLVVGTTVSGSSSGVDYQIVDDAAPSERDGLPAYTIPSQAKAPVRVGSW